MHKDEVVKLCKDIDGKLTFINISNGRHEYDNIRVVGYTILSKDGVEELVVKMTGFPTIDYENI